MEKDQEEGSRRQVWPALRAQERFPALREAYRTQPGLCIPTTWSTPQLCPEDKEKA